MGLFFGILIIIIASCSCCGCCPLYNKLCCAPRGGCCIKNDSVAPIAQAQAVEMTPVKA